MDAREARYKLQVARTLLGTGMVQPERPDKALRTLGALRSWGPSSPAAFLGGAIRFPDRAAIIDDRGALSYREVHRRTNALACELRKVGIGERQNVAIMCRNHRGFIEATVACAKLGAGALYLNTAFAGPQITDVLRREDPAAVIYDEEFSELVAEGAEGRRRFIAWSEPGSSAAEPTLEQLIAAGSDAELAGAVGERARRDPHLGHDGHAQGRRAHAARHARAGGGAVLEDPAEGARDDDDRGAAVPLLGLRALHARLGAVLDARAAQRASIQRRRSARSPSTARARSPSCP